MFQETRTADVPGIRDDEGSGTFVKLRKSETFFSLSQHMIALLLWRERYVLSPRLCKKIRAHRWQELFLAQTRKGAKTQRKPPRTRQRFASLRLCARNNSCHRAPWAFVQSLLSEPESYNLRAICDAAILLNIDCSDA